jgi:hypothetical protein
MWTVMTRHMIQIIPIMMITSNTCNTMLFCNHVLFSYLASIFTICNNMSCLFLFNCRWLNKDGRRQWAKEHELEVPEGTWRKATWCRCGCRRGVVGREEAEGQEQRQRQQEGLTSSSLAAWRTGGGPPYLELLGWRPGSGDRRRGRGTRGQRGWRQFHCLCYGQGLLARSLKTPWASTSSATPSDPPLGG